MDYVALKSLIESHPNWPIVDDAELVTWLNDDTAVTRDRDSLTPGEVMDAVIDNRAEYAALSTVDREALGLILSSYDEIPTKPGEPARTALIDILGTNTKAALAAKIPETVSRATDSGIGYVRQGDVEHARII